MPSSPRSGSEPEQPPADASASAGAVSRGTGDRVPRETPPADRPAEGGTSVADAAASDTRQAGEGQELEPLPPQAAVVFADRLALAERYTRHLSTTAVEWGLIGPRELPRLWTRHVLNCAVLGELVPDGVDVVDIGSGAGLPGLALAVARPDLHLTLVEPLERRVAWLDMVVEDLGLDVTVRRARAEELAGTVVAPVVTARAVAPLRRLAAWGLPLVAPGGELLALKGRSAQEELDASQAALRKLGAVDWSVLSCGQEVLETPTTVARVRVGDRGPGSTGRAARRAGRRRPGREG